MPVSTQTSLPEVDGHMETGVLIVGSGPMGATYAKKLVDAGIKTLMIDVGAQETRFPGEHKKNVIGFQKNMNAFINVIQGELQKLSIPSQEGHFPTLDPSSYSSKAAIWSGHNPNQRPEVNLEASAVTRSVGGMANHWTCCTPEPHKALERPDLFSDDEWKALYQKARELIDTPIDANGEGTEFENSIRQQLVKRTLLEAYKDEDSDKNAKEKRTFKAMPLACKRRKDNPDWVDWSSSSTVFGDIVPHMGADGKPKEGNPLFTLLDEHQCVSVLRDDSTGEIKGALVKDLRHRKKYFITAKRYVIAAGAVLTPQILANSGFEGHLPALGQYMTEQTMTFCQIVLKKSLLDTVEKDPWNLGWKQITDKHKQKYPSDPLPIPFHDYDPQITQPVTMKRPWHTQIHRDAFSYGLVPDTYDQRAIVDLRWFGYVTPRKENCVTFSTAFVTEEGDLNPGVTDSYGMPQPTFNFTLSPDDADRASRMMVDMCDVASKLGGYLPGALPQFMPPGAALHVCGTTRAGVDVKDSCVDKNSRVHGSRNLFLGGCNVIPTQIACNPTITAMCFAIVGADAILKDFQDEGLFSKVSNGSNGVNGNGH